MRILIGISMLLLPSVVVGEELAAMARSSRDRDFDREGCACGVEREAERRLAF